MTTVLTARDKIATLLTTVFPELLEKVEKHKRDTVEKLPSASVYVPDLSNEPVAARGHVERTVTIVVEMHRISADIEDKLITDAGTLEKALFAQRKNIAPLVKSIHVTDVALRTDPQQKNAGSLILTITLKTSADLSA